MAKEYRLNIDPRILELLGPSLYTNIYYILAEMIANSYDADASNVYILINEENITVEDDGEGMSYEDGDINKYLNIAGISRTTEEDSLTAKGRRKMGRKGVGKLAALSVSDNVLIKTISNGEKSGFILSKRVNENRLLQPLNDEEIIFEKIKGNHGTSVVMQQPQYDLHKTISAIKRNILKLFPLVNKDFKIHIFKGNNETIIDGFDSEIIKELSTLITLGNDFSHLQSLFQTPYNGELAKLCENRETKTIQISLVNNDGEEKPYNIKIDGWIGTYKTTTGRKVELTDFPDNFISLYSNKKMGEFNILPVVGQNKLAEVYIVGQLHVDIFELTELPDMALSNRQGYKTDDKRYIEVRNFIRDTLVPDILNRRHYFVSLKNDHKKLKKLEQQKANEEKFKKSVQEFKENTSHKATERILKTIRETKSARGDEIRSIVMDEINNNSPQLGIKTIVDSQKKKILISQTLADKDLSDLVYTMLLYNNVPPEDIIFNNCDNEKSRIPEQYRIYDYLRDFFVNSYSTEKLYVIFITSKDMGASWGAITEVGAEWITQVSHKIFNLSGFRPDHPLDDERQWHVSKREEDGVLSMAKPYDDIFCQKIEAVCDDLGYVKKNRIENLKKLHTLARIKASIKE